MNVTFLGTGTSQGVPVIACDCDVCSSIDYKDKRLRSSIHIAANGLSLIIDVGPDFRQQMLQHQITHIDAILLTHAHKDHTAGLDDIRSFNFKQKMEMPVYARAAVLEQLKAEFAYIFADNKYPGVPSIKPCPIANTSFTIADKTITPVEVQHFKLPVFGFIIDSFAYITDAKTIAEEEKKKLHNLDILVLNALQHHAHISHLTLNEALDLVAELQPKQAYLTHISHNLGLARDIQPTLPPNVHLAYDGLQITV